MSSSPDLVAAPPVATVRPFVPGVVPGTPRDGAGARSDGFVAGYAVGYSEGLRRATAAVAARQEQVEAVSAAHHEQLRARVADVVDRLRAEAGRLQEDAWLEADDLAQVVATCAAELAQQVVLDAAPRADVLLARLRRGLDEVGAPGEPTTVVVGAHGVAALEHAGVLPDGLPAGVTVVADPRLAPGDVVVRCGATTVTDLLVPALRAAVAQVTAEAGE